MSHRVLRKVSKDRPRTPLFGADLESKGWEEVALDRADNLPISFAGRQLTRHWAGVSSGEVLSVSLWQRKKYGFVVAFTACVAGEIRSDCVAVDSLVEAMIFLEDYCAHPPVSAPPSERLVDSILHLHRSITYTQVFGALVGEALAAWSCQGRTLPQGRFKEEAQA